MFNLPQNRQETNKNGADNLSGQGRATLGQLSLSFIERGAAADSKPSSGPPWPESTTSPCDDPGTLYFRESDLGKIPLPARSMLTNMAVMRNRHTHAAAAFLAVFLFTGLHAAPHAGQAVIPAAKRVALIIGNSQYQELGTLRNAGSDATAIDDVLKTLGFKTQLVLDASSDRTRRALRQFAGDGADADIALVFYAGHGAQVNGSNYLLPVDIEVPRFASDLALDGLKVDDLVNALRARTIVLFLDACRDNPVLFKNLPIGRGATSAGLAPATTLNANAMNGGLFIAYATDAGAVAADGTGAHSPFTDALLRHLTKSISLDDMFSLVTREVRLTTNNAQRPYKYASLDSIVCLTGTCASSQPDLPSGALEAVRRSEADDFRSALDANNAAALKTYLDTYPESPRRAEAVREWSRLRRQPFTEWTVTGVSGQPQMRDFARLASIQVIRDRVAIQTKSDDDDFELGGYTIRTLVYDCARPGFGAKVSEVQNFGATNNLLDKIKFSDPPEMDLSDAPALIPDTLGWTMRLFACTEQRRTPLVDKADLVDKTLTPFSIQPVYVGDSRTGAFEDLFYLPNHRVTFEDPEVSRHWREAVMLVRSTAPASVAAAYGITLIDADAKKKDVTYLSRADLVLIDCVSSQYSVVASEFYDADLRLVAKGSADRVETFSNVQPNTVTGTLKTLVCNQGKVNK